MRSPKLCLLQFTGWLAVVLLAGVCLRPVPAAAQTTSSPEYQNAINALYNLDFSTAERELEHLTHQYPENPEFYNTRASAIWMKVLYSQEKLSMDSFTGSQIGTRNSRNSVDPAEEKRLQDTVQAAMDAANTLLKKNPKDVHALYALGISNGILASFEATSHPDTTHYLSALSYAKTAKGYHEQVLKLDPSFVDARLSIGSYDYVVGAIPSWLRLLLLLGMGSNQKQVGIQNLEAVATKGKYAATDAKMLLSIVYTRERQFDKAIQILEELRARYPQNYTFDIGEAKAAEKAKRYDQAAQLYEHALMSAAKRESSPRLRSEVVYLSLGWVDIERDHPDDALVAYGKVVDGKATSDEKADSHLWMGKILDSRNQRSEALEHYKAVLSLDCDVLKKTEAQRWLREPFKG